MDTELLRTFLEINRTRHFGRAASNLYLTQSAVSARMRLLEQAIGTPLLTRSRNDIQLTPAGRKLLPHAEAIIERWSQAQQEVALHEEEKAGLHFGARLTIAEMIFPAWTRHLWVQRPELALNIEVVSDMMMPTRLREKTLDVAVTYDPPPDTDFKNVSLGELQLALMSTEPAQTAERAMGANYVYLEWGNWFNVSHAKHFPDVVPGGLRTSSLHLVLELLNKNDGACYLPQDVMRRIRADNLELHVVADAPILEHTAYAVYPVDSPQRGLIEEVLYELDQQEILAESKKHAL